MILQRLGELERLLQRATGVAKRAVEHQQPAVGRQRPGALGRWRVPGDQRQDLRQMRQRLVGTTRVPQRVADARLGSRGSQRLDPRIHYPARRRGKLEGKVVIASVLGHLRGAQKQRHAIGARHLLGLRNPLPQLERALQMNDGLGVGVHAVGLRSGPNRRRERCR
jgi:hypothetical protein